MRHKQARTRSEGHEPETLLVTYTDGPMRTLDRRAPCSNTPYLTQNELAGWQGRCHSLSRPAGAEKPQAGRKPIWQWHGRRPARRSVVSRGARVAERELNVEGGNTRYGGDTWGIVAALKHGSVRRRSQGMCPGGDQMEAMLGEAATRMGCCSVLPCGVEDARQTLQGRFRGRNIRPCPVYERQWPYCVLSARQVRPIESHGEVTHDFRQGRAGCLSTLRGRRRVPCWCGEFLNQQPLEGRCTHLIEGPDLEVRHSCLMKQ